MRFVYVIGAKPRGRWRRPVTAYAILTQEEWTLNVFLPHSAQESVLLPLYQAADPSESRNCYAGWEMRWSTGSASSSPNLRLYWHHFFYPNPAYVACEDVPKAREFFAGLRECLEARIAEAYADAPVDEEVYEYDWESARPAAPQLAKRRVRAVSSGWDGLREERE